MWPVGCVSSIRARRDAGRTWRDRRRDSVKYWAVASPDVIEYGQFAPFGGDSGGRLAQVHAPVAAQASCDQAFGGGVEVADGLVLD